MQELNQLKNLVMQNLQKNGYLSNIRAQIRASVFKTIDGQQSSKKASPFYTQNAKIQKMAETPQGQNSLQLIKQLMQTYNMEYSTAIFSSQANLKQPAKRQALILKNKVQSVAQGKPVLLQILQKYVKTNKKKVQKKQQKKQEKKQEKTVDLSSQLKQNQSQGQIEQQIVKNQSKKFGESEQFGQSQGYDVTVDSLKLQEYDYYQEIN